MAVLNKFRPFVAAVMNGVHDFSADTLMIALTNTVPTVAMATLSQITEIDYTNLSSRVITTTSSTETSGTYRLILVDLVLIASGTVPDFRYVVLYNDSATNKELIGWYDYGSVVQMIATETFTVDFHPTNGALSLV